MQKKYQFFGKFGIRLWYKYRNTDKLSVLVYTELNIESEKNTDYPALLSRQIIAKAHNGCKCH